MNMNEIVLIISLCFTIGLILHISVERYRDKKEREQKLREKQKRVKDALKKLDWQRK
jgi:hypothetical protein